MDNDELRDELEAFDPKWQQHYRTTREAVLAAGPRAIELFRAWCAGLGKGCAACQQIPDTLGAIERMQEAEASSGLPFKSRDVQFVGKYIGGGRSK